jgi:homoserine kinase type II
VCSSGCTGKTDPDFSGKYNYDMSVYTTVEQGELEAFLTNYSVGRLINYKGISAGIENTNYFVTTDAGDYVLTIFEWLTDDDLSYFLELMAFLAEHGVPSAHPIADNSGHYLRHLKHKPAALVNKLPGNDVEIPNTQQCAAIGSALGRLHAEGQHFSAHRDNDRGPSWWKETASRLYSHLDNEDAGMLRTEIDYQINHRCTDLPKGVLHADLFRDNALFMGNKLTGIIDFYYACNDHLLYDLAVTANDWCSQTDGTIDQQRCQALLQAYQQVRPIQASEKNCWQQMLRAAALRFWLSRLQDMHFPREGEITHIKDPDVFKRILADRVSQQYHIP